MPDFLAAALEKVPEEVGKSPINLILEGDIIFSKDMLNYISEGISWNFPNQLHAGIPTFEEGITRVTGEVIQHQVWDKLTKQVCDKLR